MERMTKLLAMLLGAALVLGCSVSTKSSEEKKGSKVDIDSPVGSLHVQTDDRARHDTGITVYPGARPAPPDEHDSSAANVNLGFAGFGLKVTAVKYLTDDPPEKVLEFYRKDLNKFGKVVECKGGDIDLHSGKNGQEITCSHHGGSDKTELGTGDSSNSHSVSVRPKGKGTEFGLVYIQTRQGEKETM